MFTTTRATISLDAFGPSRVVSAAPYQAECKRTRSDRGDGQEEEQGDGGAASVLHGGARATERLGRRHAGETRYASAWALVISAVSGLVSVAPLQLKKKHSSFCFHCTFFVKSRSLFPVPSQAPSDASTQFLK